MPDVEAASQVQSAVAEKTVSDGGRSLEPADRPPPTLSDAGPDGKLSVTSNVFDGRVRCRERELIKARDAAFQGPAAPRPPCHSAVAENAAAEYAGSGANSFTTVGTAHTTQVIQPSDMDDRYQLRTVVEGRVGDAGDGGGTEEPSSRKAPEVQEKGAAHGRYTGNDSADWEEWWGDDGRHWTRESRHHRWKESSQW